MNEENKPLGKSDPLQTEKAIRNIKTAWIAGVIIGSLSTIMLIVSFFIKNGTIYSGPFLFLAILVFGFSYGIYKKSRICSIIILIMWILATLTFAINGELVPALIGAIICIPFYIGLRGTLAYYKLDTLTKMMYRE